MPAPVVRVQGLARFKRTLRDFEDGVEDLKDANAAAAALVAAEAQARAPRRSGALAGSVRGNRAAGKAVVAAGKAKVPYAGPIHWGWPARGIPARPFITQAATATQQRWLSEYEANVQALADKVEGM